MSMNIHLVTIDPQLDFCHKDGALFVQGADQDIPRLAKMVRRFKDKLSDIHVTMDSHHLIHIAHPIFWKDSKGNHPNPFTLINVEDVENGTWTTTNPAHYRRALDYVKTLKKNNRYVLCIWNPHCLIGSWGYGIVPEFFDALLEWERDFAMVDLVTKGSNMWSEHYSALLSDVPDASDVSTQLNTRLIQILEEADIILCAGEAGSHCVANTFLDLANNFSNMNYISKMVLLEDAISPVPGFEQLQVDFIAEMKNRGMKLAKTTDF
jgi:nicotinamidase/pyrazinamidase